MFSIYCAIRRNGTCLCWHRWPTEHNRQYRLASSVVQVRDSCTSVECVLFARQIAKLQIRRISKIGNLYDSADVWWIFVFFIFVAMAVWNLFWLILLIVVIFMVVRKIRNEAKVKNGRIQLAGKVTAKYFAYLRWEDIHLCFHTFFAGGGDNGSEFGHWRGIGTRVSCGRMSCRVGVSSPGRTWTGAKQLVESAIGECRTTAIDTTRNCSIGFGQCWAVGRKMRTYIKYVQSRRYSDQQWWCQFALRYDKRQNWGRHTDDVHELFWCSDIDERYGGGKKCEERNENDAVISYFPVQVYCHRWWNGNRGKLFSWVRWSVDCRFRIVRRTQHQSTQCKHLRIVCVPKWQHTIFRCSSQVPVMLPPKFRWMHWPDMEQHTVVNSNRKTLFRPLMWDSFLFCVATVMDPETAAGETPQQCANGIVRGMLCDDNELIPFRYVLVVWLRVTLPWLYFALMERRAEKLAPRYRNTTQSIWVLVVVREYGFCSFQ